MAATAQFVGSLLAVVTLALLVRRLRLGAVQPWKDGAAVRADALCALPLFDPVEIALDPEGAGALLRDTNGRVAFLRRHGAHPVARLLPRGSATALTDDRLHLDWNEPRFGAPTLNVPDAGYWVRAINSGETGRGAR